MLGVIADSLWRRFPAALRLQTGRLGCERPSVPMTASTVPTRASLKNAPVQLQSFQRSSSGSLAKFAAILRASSRVSSFAAERRPGSSCK
jgi:hypothetical protein